MVYRVAASTVLGPSFWRERNDLSFDWQAIRAADSKIVSGVKRLVSRWYGDTLRKYPRTYPFILDDLSRASIGKGGYVRLSGESKNMIGVLTAALDLDGLLPSLLPEAVVLQEDVDLSALAAATKESAVRWIKVSPQLDAVIEAAFKASVTKIDPTMASQYPGVPGADLLEGLYFRAARQGDLIFFQSPRLAQELFVLQYE